MIRLFTLTSVLSLLLLAATVVMWMWSYARPETFLWEHCDGLSSARFLNRDRPSRKLADWTVEPSEGPTADRTVELTLYCGGVRLRREWFLNETRTVALNAHGKPAAFAGAGWHLVAHFAGGSLGFDRWNWVMGPDWCQGRNEGGPPDELPAFELSSGLTPAFVDRHGSFVELESVSAVSVRFWMLVALALVCPGWWIIRYKWRKPKESVSTQNLIRAALTFASAVSLLLCAAAIKLWVSSYHEVSELECYYQRTHGDKFTTATAILAFTKGELSISMMRINEPRQDRAAVTPDGFRWTTFSPPYDTTEAQWHGSGFGWNGVRDFDSSINRSVGRWSLLIPLWFVALILAAPPAYCVSRGFRFRRQMIRRSLRLCTNCGYDLRASPDRCPECGTLARPPTIAPADSQTPRSER